MADAPEAVADAEASTGEKGSDNTDYIQPAKLESPYLATAASDKSDDVDEVKRPEVTDDKPQSTEEPQEEDESAAGDDKEIPAYDTLYLATCSDLNVDTYAPLNVSLLELNEAVKMEIGGGPSGSFCPALRKCDESPCNYYICGEAGSGKTSLARNIVLAFQKMYPDKTVLFFSDKPDDSSLMADFSTHEKKPAPPFAFLGKVDRSGFKRVPLSAAAEINTAQDISVFEDCLFLFDDCNNKTSTDQDAIQVLQNTILNHGRSKRIGCIIINHALVGPSTIGFRRESYGVVLFHTRGVLRAETKRYLTQEQSMTPADMVSLGENLKLGSPQGVGWFMLVGDTCVTQERIFSLSGTASLSASKTSARREIKEKRKSDSGEGGAEEETPPEKKKKKHTSYTCPVEGCGYVATKKSYLANHAKKVHDKE